MKNFALGIVDVNDKKYKVIYTVMLKHTIVSLKGDIRENIGKFYNEIKKILKKYRPTKLMAERFMSRGRFGQAIGECLSFMLGIIALICRQLKIEFVAITSASWKNSFQFAMKKSLDGLYKHLRPLPPHIVDSILQATYGVNPKYTNWQIQPLRKLQSGYIQSRKNTTKSKRKS